MFKNLTRESVMVGSTEEGVPGLGRGGKGLPVDSATGDPTACSGSHPCYLMGSAEAWVAQYCRVVREGFP